MKITEIDNDTRERLANAITALNIGFDSGHYEKAFDSIIHQLLDQLVFRDYPIMYYDTNDEESNSIRFSDIIIRAGAIPLTPNKNINFDAADDAEFHTKSMVNTIMYKINEVFPKYRFECIKTTSLHISPVYDETKDIDTDLMFLHFSISLYEK